MRHLARFLLPCLALALVLPAGPLLAKPDAATFAAIDLAISQAAGDAVLLALAQTLADRPSAPALPQFAAPEANAAQGQVGDMQLALTQLSILSGSNGHLILQLAQDGRKDALYLTSGAATLADLQATGLLKRQGKVWHLNRPLVIWPGASLTLTPGEVLEMAPASGAFVLSFGALNITGATLRAGRGANAVIPAFRPFVLVTGQGSFAARDAAFEGLGFPGPLAFRGLSILTGGVMRPATPPRITGSHFTTVGALNVAGADGLMLIGNRFDGAFATAVFIDGGTGITIADNRIRQTSNGAGMRLDGALADLTITGNLVTGGARNGIQVDGTTQGLTLAGNVVIGNGGAGVVVSHATCATLFGNIIAQNGTTGLRLTASGAVDITGNAIYANGSAGVEVQAQTGLAPIRLSDNALRGNREGLRAAGLAEVRLNANELALQTPRQFAGDFAPWLAAYLTQGDAAFVIPAAAGAFAPAAPCTVE